ncbi:MAG: RecX family transcriptional regulator [Coriobacteriales bacterium]|jgi:regulatory protein|nr:RecX family transcriptional regulator [Coriobacteriales bacterium]
MIDNAKTKKASRLQKCNPCDAEAAFTKLVQLCCVRERSAYELRKRLLNCGFDAQACDNAINRAIACEIVNDMRFADAWIRGKLNLGWGIRRIEREIKHYGICANAFTNWPDCYSDGANERKRALAELERHRPRAKNVRAARFRHLLNKGYAADVAHQALLVFESEAFALG